MGGKAANQEDEEQDDDERNSDFYIGRNIVKRDTAGGSSSDRSPGGGSAPRRGLVFQHLSIGVDGLTQQIVGFARQGGIVLSLGQRAFTEHGNLQKARKDFFGNNAFAVEIIEHIGEIPVREIIPSAQTPNQSVEGLA